MAEHTKTLWRVTQPFSFDANGQQYSMRTGDLVDEQHPAYKSGGRIYLEEVNDGSGMRDVAVQAARAVETATAAPGERRATSSPRKGA